MKYFLITDLQGSCSDYGLAMYLRSLQRGLGIIQFVVPVILIIMAAINLVQLMLSPDDPQKKRWKSLTNKFVAAIIVFFIPLLVNIFFSFMPETVDIANCWKVAKEKADEMDTQKEINKSTKTESQTIYPTSHESENKDKLLKEKNIALKKNVMLMDSDASEDNTTSDSKDGKEVVKYARRFLGNPYVYGGNSLTKGTDCSGFVKLVYAHFGIELPRTASAQSQVGKVVKSISEAQPGDLLFYIDGSGQIGHVTMYEGDNKVIHASSPSTGIKESDISYRKYVKIKRVL